MNVWVFSLGALFGAAAALVGVRLAGRASSQHDPAEPEVVALQPESEPEPELVVTEVAAPPRAPTLRRVPGEVLAVEEAIAHRFINMDLAERAFTHRSYIAEHQGSRSYERLEFLGDAVLQLAVTRYLYEAHPELAEGEMAKVRSAVVSEPVLAEFAGRFKIAPALKLGKGEESTGGREKESILSDVVESVIGALFLETDMETARRFVIGHWQDAIEQRVTAPGRGDYKTRLQEILAQQGKHPEYRLAETGPAHARSFAAEVWVGDRLLGSGEGSSKKRAHQAAARAALSRLA